jgi:ADP-ribose pyrophosphatase
MADQKYREEETTLLPLKIEHKGIVYKDNFKKIEKIHALFNGFTKEYFVSDYGVKAAVVVVKDGDILLARQYPLLINGLSYEIPAGKVNSGESPKDAARRECLEETGFKCKNLKRLLSYDQDLEYTRNRTHVFYAGVPKGVMSRKSQCAWKPLRECLNMIYKGKILDSLSIISILAYANTIGK